MGLISWIVIGLIVGFVGKVALGRRSGNLPLVAGLVGGVVGGVIAAIFGASIMGFSFWGAVMALIFAILAMAPARVMVR
jgi:uncharacterized membrane protein YeaQ/YmgE (transglycosylase-associated protein family)